MSPDEAKKFGLSEAERRNLIRLDSGKVNIAPPAREAKKSVRRLHEGLQSFLSMSLIEAR